MEGAEFRESNALREEQWGDWRITYHDPAVEWWPFLKEWSEKYIAWHDPDREPAPGPEAVREGWMGFSPATPAEIAALEGRLGLTLPPALRALLSTTNGWRSMGSFCPALRTTTEIDFMGNLSERTILRAVEVETVGATFWPGSAVLERAVQISVGDDDNAVLLDPGDVNDDGEWAVYVLADCFVIQGYGSLTDLMVVHYLEFYENRCPDVG